jgi:hypothetical protein
VIGYKLIQMATVVLFASFKMMAEQAQVVNIGDVSELTGNAQVLRDKPYIAELDFNIQQNDNVETTNGRIAIKFLDDSTVKLTEHSQLTIDEYIFDPNPTKSKLALNFASGTARFITGQLGRIDKENITIQTPTANIAIRGTDFTATVDELGRSLIILLPDADGISSGEIMVTTAMGTVLLNKPYEATTTTVFESSPSKPVILDLTLDLIDNMLIVKPPQEDVLQKEESTISSDNVLDVDFLEFDGLDADYFAKDELEFTELDINFLDVNFFEDLLKIIDELDKLNEDDLNQEQTITRVTGTKVGQDTETQIITLVQGELISLRRQVEQSAQVDLNSSQGYTVIFIQNGVSNTVKINGGGDSVIKIVQGS